MDVAADTELTPTEALNALEAFVVDNDDLVELEESIGRFNIFDALGIVRAEIRHSNFLAWLLDPAESHGTGQLFLRAVLMDILHRASTDIRPLSPVEIDGLELGGVEVRREQDNIDILIAADDPKIVVAIENKIDSDEHSNQLQRYRATVSKRYPDHEPLFVFLTREGDEPTDDNWSPYSYADLHSSLSRVRRLNDNAIGDDVLVFLDQYIRMIGSRFMDDPKIDELCDRIYHNHRQALDLIFERKGDPRKVLASAFQDALCEDTDFWLSTVATYKCQFIPREWVHIVPPVARSTTLSEHALLRGVLVVRPKRVELVLHIGPSSDDDLRVRLLETIAERGSGSGLMIPSITTTRFTRVKKKRVLMAGTDVCDDEESIAAVQQLAREMRNVFEPITPLLREAFG